MLHITMSSQENEQIDAIGSSCFQKDASNRSLNHYKKALSTRRSEKTPYSSIDIKLYTCIGTLYNNKGGEKGYRLAIENYTRALSLHQEIFGVEDPAQAAASCNNIGTVYYQQRDFQPALTWYQKALHMLLYDGLIENSEDQSLKEVVADKDSRKIDGQVNQQNRKAEMTVKTCSNLGSAYHNIGAKDKSIECYKLGLSFLRSRRDEENMTKEEKEKNFSCIASIYTNIASVYSLEGSHSKSLKYHERAMRMREKAFGDGAEVASSLQSIGNEYFQAKQFDEARSAYLRALEIRKRVLAEKHPAIAATDSSLGCVNYQLGNYIEAIRNYREAIEIEETRVLRNASLTNTYTNLGEALKKAGEYDEALEAYEKAFKIQKEYLGTDHHPSLYSILMNMGKLKRKRGNHGEALQHFTKCRLFFEEEEDSNSLNTNTTQSSASIAKLYTHVASSHEMIGDYGEAAKYYTKVLSIQETELGHIHEDTANTYHRIGQTYESNGNEDDFDRALNYYKLCFASRKEQFGIFDRRTMNAGAQIARMWAEQCKRP